METQHMADEWPFDDAKDVAVFTTKQVLRLGQPILHVSHDEDDGAWQFHTGAEQLSSSDAMVVALSEIVEHDKSIAGLADLPCAGLLTATLLAVHGEGHGDEPVA